MTINLRLLADMPAKTRRFIMVVALDRSGDGL